MAKKYKREISVFVVDDHQIVRAGLVQLLEKNGIKVIAEASTGQDALERYNSIKPDVVMLDISLPGMNGFQVLRTLMEKDPHCRVVVMTMYKNKEYVMEALKYGAKGYVVKDAESYEILESVNKVYNNEIYLCESVKDIVLKEMSERLRSGKKLTEYLLKEKRKC